MRKSGFLLSILLLSLSMAVVAPASANPTPKVTGTIEVAPLAYWSFEAFDVGESIDDRGEIRITEFNTPDVGTDVWDIRDWDTLWVVATYEHDVVVDEIVPTSMTGYDFTAHGQYVGGYTWTMTGTVDGDTIAYTLYRDASDYWFTATGTIASDGSMAGTATHSANDAALTWMAPATSGHEVFHYVTDVTCAEVSGNGGVFGWTTPGSSDVVALVYDGGSPGHVHDSLTLGFLAHDCIAQGIEIPVGIHGGNIVVH